MPYLYLGTFRPSSFDSTSWIVESGTQLASSSLALKVLTSMSRLYVPGVKNSYNLRASSDKSHHISNSMSSSGNTGICLDITSWQGFIAPKTSSQFFFRKSRHSLVSRPGSCWCRQSNCIACFHLFLFWLVYPTGPDHASVPKGTYHLHFLCDKAIRVRCEFFGWSAFKNRVCALAVILKLARHFGGQDTAPYLGVWKQCTLRFSTFVKKCF